MNFQIIENNLTLLEIFYTNVGSTWTNETIYLTLLPIGLIGLCLNIISFIVFVKIKIKSTKLYSYLRVYTLNSCMMCSIGMISFLPFTPRYFKLTGNYYIVFFQCFILNYVAANFYLFGNLLDIVICFERLSIFIRMFKKIQHYSPYLISFILLIISFLINAPILFWFRNLSEDEFYSSSLKLNNESFTMCGRTQFLKTNFGLIISIVAIFVRDIVTLTLEITLSIVMIYYMRMFFKNKMNNIPIFNNNNTIQNHSTTRIEEFDKNFDRTLRMMTFIQLLAILTHSITFGIFLTVIKDQFDGTRTNYIKNYGVIVANLLKNFSNFFLFYNFNLNFKKVIHLKPVTITNTN